MLATLVVSPGLISWTVGKSTHPAGVSFDVSALEDTNFVNMHEPLGHVRLVLNSSVQQFCDGPYVWSLREA